MDNQHGTVDRIVETAAEPDQGPAGTGADLSPPPGLSALFGSPVTVKEGMMSQTATLEEAPAALVGSFTVFTLDDVLSMLASTQQTGELQVVSETVDGRLWLDHGEFSNAHVGTATTIGQAVFELACVSDGWFYFTTGLVSSSGQPTVPVAAVLTEVRPQVDEWRDIRQVVPPEAIVTLAPDPPGQDVQIRSDQWRVLTTVGTGGNSVRSVLEMIGGDQIVGLRTLRDLHTAGLIELTGPPDEPADGDPAPTYAAPLENGSSGGSLPSSPPLILSEDPGVEGLTAVPPPVDLEPAVGLDDSRFTSLAEVAIMPPPIAGDPWAPTVGSNSSDDNGVA